MSFPQRLSGVFLASGMTFFFCYFRKKMYPLKSLFGVWKKTQVRFTSNASAFNLKRKGVLP
jgi:NADH:ubiquinone oxidoreductase subunit 4 (subunit M)